MKLISLQSLTLILILSLVGVSCDDAPSGVDSSESATFKGKVESTSSQQVSKTSASSVEGAVVTAARVNTDGSLEPIGNSGVQTNAKGEYTLKVDVSSDSSNANRIVIMAESSGQTAKAFVASKVESGSTITVQPITFESSAEAEVYQKIVANGNADLVTKADIEVAVDNEVAADIESNPNNAASIASGIVSAAKAKTKFYAEKGIEISEEQHKQIVQAKQDAQVQLATELDAATSAEARQAAYEAFIQTMAHAELEADIEAWAVTESNDLVARLLLHESTELSTEAQSEMRQQMYYFTAVTMDAAVRAQTEALEASEATVSAIADAGATLKTDIKNTTNASKGAIDDLFVRFNETVQAAINSDTSLNGNAFVAVNTAINGSANLKSTLETTLGATADPDIMVSAYNTFKSGVEALVNSTFTKADEAKAKAYTRTLVLINISS